jgi:hypothetical protein
LPGRSFAWIFIEFAIPNVVSSHPGLLRPGRGGHEAANDAIRFSIP